MSDPMRGVFRGFDITNSALTAEMARAEVIASNLMNMHDTGGPDRDPYRRKTLVFEEMLDTVGAATADGLPAAGVRIGRVYEDTTTDFTPVYDPGHPHADGEGFVRRSNVDLFRELMDMTVVRRSFQANLSAMRTYRGMLQATIQNFRS